MTTRFEEEYLAFEFGDRWRILKLDEHHDYRERIEKVDETFVLTGLPSVANPAKSGGFGNPPGAFRDLLSSSDQQEKYSYE